MATEYTAAPATAPMPIPTDEPLTGEELPESPPMGDPFPKPAEDSVVAPGFEPDVPDGSLDWEVVPGRIGMVGLIIVMRVRTVWSGLVYAGDMGA